MQTPGNKFVGTCSHCGNKERVVVVINVEWPENCDRFPGDGRFSVERLCEDACFERWGTQLEALGCKLDPTPGVKAFMAVV